MRAFFVLWRREASAYVTGPAAYVTMLLVLVITGAGFWAQATISRGEPVRLDVLMFWLPTLWLMVMMVATVGTMRLFAEEKRSGTIETLMTAPVTETQVVLAKYMAALTLYVAVFAPTVLHVFILQRLSTGIEAVDSGPLAAGYSIVLLVGAFYVAVGVLMSALTRSQVVAAIGTFAVLCILFLVVGVLGQMTRGPVARLLQALSSFEHIKEFARGVVDSRTVVLYVSGTALALFSTVKVLESRRWL